MIGDAGAFTGIDPGLEALRAWRLEFVLPYALV